MTAPTRLCPRCAHAGPLRTFALVPADLRPPQHRRRRVCPACGHDGPAWVFRGRALEASSVDGDEEDEEAAT